MGIVVSNQTFDEERALYNMQEGVVENCVFAGPRDGESVLKEIRGVTVQDCSFSLRYPLWHARRYRLLRSNMDDKTRAPIWYAQDGSIEHCTIDGIKALRECADTRVENCIIHSPEFGWKCRGLELRKNSIQSEYFLLETSDVKISELHLTGKYSFQYVKNARIRDSVLDTKDAFWHSQNITVEDSVVKGEYLGWFSEGLTLINCKIIGTQPLCYCKNLRLVDCTMEDTDLSFEYSEVEATVQGHIVSVKNPKSGTIVADSVGEIIREGSIMETEGKVVIRQQTA